MLGIKVYQEKLFTNFSLASKIPDNNFYKQLKKELDLSFLYKVCKPYYGECGQKSIDPIVFFKLMLIGYLEGVTSDRKLIDVTNLRIDILYFINYDIDEELPWHSTISRTRKKLPTKIFDQAFDKVVSMCIEKGMVAGHTQSIDSALIKANASLENIELKQPKLSIDSYLEQVKQQDKEDMEEEQKPKPRKNIKRSNTTHYSPSDPDAKIAYKPGKPTDLYYQSQMSVDSAHCVITHIEAKKANNRDSTYLIPIVEKTKSRLNRFGLLVSNILADTNYSSGKNYFDLENLGLQAYIPPHGQYRGGPDDFIYDKNKDEWECPGGERLTLRREFIRDGLKKKNYSISIKICKACQFYQECIGNRKEKSIIVSAYKENIDRAIQRISTKQGRHYKGKRQATVEPVFGSLMNNMGMKKVLPKSISTVNKVFIMTAIAYNLKKYMKFITYKANAKRAALLSHFKTSIDTAIIKLFNSVILN